jgi:FAD/FMN-containing dehydrogenase
VQDVQQTVRVLARINVLGNQCPFAVRAGAHGKFGYSNQPGGVNVDLRALNTVNVDLERKVASIGPGATWTQVAAEMDPLQLVVPGGRDGDVGVGGLSLAGGISYFAPMVGFTCDNVISYQIVVASGEIVTASLTSNLDLLRALRGGGNNFGIVTRIDIKVFPLTSMWGGTTYYDIQTAQQQLQAFQAFSSDPDYDVKAYAYQSFGFTPASTVVLNNIAYAGAPSVLPAKLAALNEATPALFSTLRVTNLSAILLEQAAASPRGLRQVTNTVTFHLNHEMLEDSFEIWNNSLSKVRNVPNIVYSWTLEPLPASMLAKSAASAGGNVFGLPSNNQTLILGLLSASYTNPEDDGLILATTDQVTADIEARASTLGILEKWKYAGYAGRRQRVIESYGSKNVAFLRSVSRKYDPLQLFQKALPGGYKL